jgi:NDP-sugar pyrophosphorylase family protein
VTSSPLSALVLTAGLGTRLRPLTLVRAKPAAPVAGVPLVGRILRWLHGQGVREAVLNLHYLPDTITRLVGDGAGYGLRVRYSWEDPVLGSAGGPRRALPLLASDPFLIVNGDTLTDVDLEGLARGHREHGARVTMALVPNREPDRYGGVLVDDEDRVTGFTRKGDARPSWHFVGVQAAAHEVFEGLKDGAPAESVSGVYRSLIESEPGSVRAFRTEAAFHDIGTAVDYLRTSLAFASTEGLVDLPVGTRVRIGPGSRLHHTAIWDDVVIGAGCALDGCVVGDGVVVPSGAAFTGCMLVPASACGKEFLPYLRGDFVAVPFP